VELLTHPMGYQGQDKGQVKERSSKHLAPWSVH
jgi:hypothetical protein